MYIYTLAYFILDHKIKMFLQVYGGKILCIDFFGIMYYTCKIGSEK